MEEKIQYIKFATRPFSVAREEPYIRYMLKEGLKAFVSVRIDSTNASYFVDKKSYYIFLKNLLDTTLKGWESHLKKYTDITQNLIFASKEVKAAVDGEKNHKEILNAYKKYFEAVITLGPYIFIPYALKEYVEQEILEEFPNKFEIITSLDRPTEFHKFQSSLLTEPADKIKEKFDWLNVYSFYEKSYTIKHIKELKKTIDREEIKKTFFSFGENKKKFKDFINTIDDPKKTAICTLMHEYAFLRTDKSDVWRKGLYNIMPFFEYLAKLISPRCELKYVVNLSAEEIECLLKGTEIPSMNELEKRKGKKGIFYYAQNKFRFISDKMERKRILEQIEKTSIEEDKIEGTPACKGIARGRVKLIKKEDDFKDFKKGQIIVAYATEPKFTIYMDKAAAIITDEGGITCHASIVAREFGIPCIIGTINATKILKDGDLVEVDADKGIVRKIG